MRSETSPNGELKDGGGKHENSPQDPGLRQRKRIVLDQHRLQRGYQAGVEVDRQMSPGENSARGSIATPTWPTAGMLLRASTIGSGPRLSGEVLFKGSNSEENHCRKGTLGLCPTH